MLELIGQDVGNIVCTQPFGCLPNHIVGKGMMRIIKERNPQSNIVAKEVYMLKNRFLEIPKMFRIYAPSLACVLLTVITVLTGCQSKDTIPQSEFPLSEESLMAALDETGLHWSIEQELNGGTETQEWNVYLLHRPEDREGYNGVDISSRDTEEYGRRLKINFREPQNRQWWPEEEESVACWEDWQDMLVLVARLYGGFEDAEEIYRACSAVELPQDEHLLWEGTLSGGYFYMNTEKLMKPERFSMGNTVSFNVYESEEAYLKHRRIFEERKKENAAQ